MDEEHHWKLASDALYGNEKAQKKIQDNKDVRETLRKPLLYSAWACFLSSFVLYSLLLAFLMDRPKQFLTRELIKQYYKCDPLTDKSDQCQMDTLYLREQYEVSLSFLFVLCIMVMPFHVAVIINVSSKMYHNGIWYAWILLHYFVMVLCIFALFFLPTAFLFYKLIHLMKMYALTFEKDIPFM